MSHRILLALVFAFAAFSVAAQEVSLPGEPPEFFMVTSITDEGFVLQRRPPPTKLIDVPNIVYKVALQATDAKGNMLTGADVSKRLKKGSVVLVSADEAAVDPVLPIVKDDTVVRLDVVPAKAPPARQYWSNRVRS